MINSKQLKEIVIEFVRLQLLIMTSFEKHFPKGRDWKHLLDFPDSGKFTIASEKWAFNKHGSGIRFESSDDTVVDVHTRITESEIFDAWRLLQFLESRNVVVEDQISERGLEVLLDELVAEQILESVSQGRREYQIVESRGD